MHLCSESKGKLIRLLSPTRKRQTRPFDYRELIADETFHAMVEEHRTSGYFRDVKEGTSEFDRRMESMSLSYSQVANEKRATLFRNQGIEYARLGEYREAVSCYDRALEMSFDVPSKHITLVNRAAVFVKKCMYAEALLDARTAVRLQPQYATAHSLVGLCCSSLGNYGDAIASFERSIELNPSDHIAPEMLAHARRCCEELSEIASVDGDAQKVNRYAFNDLKLLMPGEPLASDADPSTLLTPSGAEKPKPPKGRRLTGGQMITPRGELPHRIKGVFAGGVPESSSSLTSPTTPDWTAREEFPGLLGDSDHIQEADHVPHPLVDSLEDLQSGEDDRQDAMFAEPSCVTPRSTSSSQLDLLPGAIDEPSPLVQPTSKIRTRSMTDRVRRSTANTSSRLYSRGFEEVPPEGGRSQAQSGINRGQALLRWEREAPFLKGKTEPDSMDPRSGVSISLNNLDSTSAPKRTNGRGLVLLGRASVEPIPEEHLEEELGGTLSADAKALTEDKLFSSRGPCTPPLTPGPDECPDAPGRATLQRRIEQRTRKSYDRDLDGAFEKVTSVEAEGLTAGRERPPTSCLTSAGDRDPLWKDRGVPPEREEHRRLRPSEGRHACRHAEAKTSPFSSKNENDGDAETPRRQPGGVDMKGEHEHSYVAGSPRAVSASEYLMGPASNRTHRDNRPQSRLSDQTPTCSADDVDNLEHEHILAEDTVERLLVPNDQERDRGSEDDVSLIGRVSKSTLPGSSGAPGGSHAMNNRRLFDGLQRVVGSMTSASGGDCTLSSKVAPWVWTWSDTKNDRLACERWRTPLERSTARVAQCPVIPQDAVRKDPLVELIHIQDNVAARVVVWLEEVTMQRRSKDVSLLDWLRDGTILVSLVNAVRPGIAEPSKRILEGTSKGDPEASAPSVGDNLESFFQACETLGVPREAHFKPKDLMSESGLERVVRCLEILGITVPQTVPLYLGPRLAPPPYSE